MFQAAWAVLSSRYSGESDVVFGSTRTGRWTGSTDSDVRIGLFINTLPMRVDVDDDALIEPWLRSLRAKQIALRPFEHTPLAAVHGWSGVDRRTPLFESIVIYDHRTLDAVLQIPGRHFDYVGQTNFPIALRAYGDEEMVVRLEYSAERFSHPAVVRMLAHLVNLLTHLADGDTAYVGDLDPVGVDERAALVGAEPRPLFDTPDGTLHAGFARQAAATPEAVAVSVETVMGREELTYSELDRRAEAVAAHLRSLGVTTNQPVGLRVERSADVVVGMLAILKAGGAYLPMDPVYPSERVAFMLEDAQARVVLTQRALVGQLAALPVQCICLDAPLPPAPSLPSEPGHASGDDLAYVMYTSGSTGKPKGVPITHHHVLRLFAATDEWFDVGPDDVWTLFHSYSFDISVWEIWGALLSGGRLAVVTRDVSRDPREFHAMLHREGVTMLCQTPTAFRSLIDVDQVAPAAAFDLRDIIFVGEALEPHILKPWIDRYGDTSPRLVNMYGPHRSDGLRRVSTRHPRRPRRRQRHRRAHPRPEPLRPGHPPQAGADRGARRAVHRRSRRRRRLPQPARPHRPTVPARSVPRRSCVPQRGPGSAPRERRLRIPRPHRPAGQDSRSPHRARRNRGRDRRASGRPPGRRDRPGGRSRREEPHRLPRRRRPATEPDRGTPRRPARAAAGLHDSHALPARRRPAANPQRQARPQRASHSATTPFGASSDRRPPAPPTRSSSFPCSRRRSTGATSASWTTSSTSAVIR